MIVDLLHTEQILIRSRLTAYDDIRLTSYGTCIQQLYQHVEYNKREIPSQLRVNKKRITVPTTSEPVNIKLEPTPDIHSCC